MSDHDEACPCADCDQPAGHDESPVLDDFVIPHIPKSTKRYRLIPLDGTDQPNPTCLVDHGSCVAPGCDCWCHAPIEDVLDQPNPTTDEPTPEMLGQIADFFDRHEPDDDPTEDNR